MASNGSLFTPVIFATLSYYSFIAFGFDLTYLCFSWKLLIWCACVSVCCQSWIDFRLVCVCFQKNRFVVNNSGEIVEFSRRNVKYAMIHQGSICSVCFFPLWNMCVLRMLARLQLCSWHIGRKKVIALRLTILHHTICISTEKLFCVSLSPCLVISGRSKSFYPYWPTKYCNNLECLLLQLMGCFCCRSS